MAEPFVGEIRMFAGTFAPRSHAFCNGQLISISQNEALFSLLGTIYGGDGRTTFALPDLRGRLAIHQGTGPGLSPRSIGERGGAETVALGVNQIPSHRHEFNASANVPSADTPLDNVAADTGTALSYRATSTEDPPVTDVTPDVNMARSTDATGNSQAHQNVMPYQCINYIIALFGIYPSRS